MLALAADRVLAATRQKPPTPTTARRSRGDGARPATSSRPTSDDHRRSAAIRDNRSQAGLRRNRLANFLLDPHPKMPNMSLTRTEAADIAAYIRHVRRARSHAERALRQTGMTGTQCSACHRIDLDNQQPPALGIRPAYSCERTGCPGPRDRDETEKDAHDGRNDGRKQASAAAGQSARADGTAQRRRQQAEHLGPHRDERPSPTRLVHRPGRRHRRWPAGGRRSRRRQPDQGAANPLALEGLSPVPRPHQRDRQPGRRVADRVRRPAEHPADQSRTRRPAAGHSTMRCAISIYTPATSRRRTSTAPTPAAPSCPTKAATPTSRANAARPCAAT